MKEDDDDNPDEEQKGSKEKGTTSKSPQKSQKKGGLGEYKSSPRLQREMSNKSLNSKATEADSSM